MSDLLGWQRLVRRIGFNEQAVWRDETERLALARFPRLQIISRETEIGAQFGEGGHHLHRSAETVQDKSPFRSRPGLEQIQHTSPSLQTMNADRQIAIS